MESGATHQEASTKGERDRSFRKNLIGVVFEPTAVEFGVLYITKIVEDTSICDLVITIQFKWKYEWTRLVWYAARLFWENI